MKKGSFLIALGVLLILGALGLTGYNLWDSHRAGAASQEVLAVIKAQIEETAAAQNGDPDVGEAVEAAESELSIGELYPDREMPAFEINGCRYIGYLSVPSTGLELPIMEEWDYSRLRIAPCRYDGSVYQDDLVLAGHNYRSHFSPLKYLDVGTEIDFTDADGIVWRYQIAYSETLQPTQVDDLLDAEAAECDLTLFTCNTGGRTRCVIRCVRMED